MRRVTHSDLKVPEQVAQQLVAAAAPAPSPREPEAPAEPARRNLAPDYDPISALFGRAADAAGADLSAPAQSAGASSAAEGDAAGDEFADDADSSIDAMAELSFPGSLGADVPSPSAVATNAADGGGARLAVQAALMRAGEESFDRTLPLPKPGDSVEERRSRLVGRVKIARTAFKVLGHLDMSEDERKETSALWGEYESKLKAAIVALPDGAAVLGNAKRDTAAVHRVLPREALDELERAATRIEERLLAIDAYVPQEAFCARINKDKHPPKVLLRYARMIGSRRFSVGFRRDRFEFLVTELLTAKGTNGLLRLLPRDKAKAVLQQLLTGLPQPSDESAKESAVAYLREQLERLSTLETHKDFFDSGFFMDVHGYKVSMREHATSPEFLYLSVALNVEIQNRIEGWIATIEGLQKANQLSQDGPPREYLYGQLRAQEESVQSVFGGFRQPKERAAQQAPQRQQEPKVSAKTGKRNAVRQTKGSSELAELFRNEMLKLAVAGVVSLLSLGYVLYATGTVSVTDNAIDYYENGRMEALSPLLVRAVSSDHKFDGVFEPHKWHALDAHARQDAADRLAAQLKAAGVSSANISSNRVLAVTIEQGLVSFVDEDPQH